MIHIPSLTLVAGILVGLIAIGGQSARKSALTSSECGNTCSVINHRSE